MDTVAIASTEADAAAERRIREHHTEMVAALGRLVDSLLTAAAQGDGAAGNAAREDLLRWCAADLVPHALAEEDGLYRAAAARPEGRALIEALVAEHGVIRGLTEEIGDAADLVRAAAAARALLVTFTAHAGKENDLVLPLLAAAPDVSLAALLDDMHAALEPQEPAPAGHACGCGEAHEAAAPELDVRTVPHAIRHATVFGALSVVPPDGALVLVAPHDPLPLLRQIEERHPGEFSVDYSERGPQTWRLTFTRRAS